MASFESFFYQIFHLLSLYPEYVLIPLLVSLRHVVLLHCHLLYPEESLPSLLPGPLFLRKPDPPSPPRHPRQPRLQNVCELIGRSFPRPDCVGFPCWMQISPAFHHLCHQFPLFFHDGLLLVFSYLHPALMSTMTALMMPSPIFPFTSMSTKSGCWRLLGHRPELAGDSKGTPRLALREGTS